MITPERIPFKAFWQTGPRSRPTPTATFIWSKAIDTQQQKIQKQLESLWAYAQKGYKAELQ